MTDLRHLRGSRVAERYRIGNAIADGARSTVFRARDERADRDVALKILRPELATDDNARGRFQREAMAVHAVGSKHIVELLDHGELPDGTPFLAFELLRGWPLRKVLQQRQRLNVEQAVWIGVAVCEGLGAAHHAGIVHRNLKPENIFIRALDSGGHEVKVLDFGMSKLPRASAGVALTTTGAMLGTLSYMAPEQMTSARDVDARADVYSLGVVLYESLAGRPPYGTEQLTMMMIGQSVDDPERLSAVRSDVGRALDRAILGALRQSADARTGSMQELREELGARA